MINSPELLILLHHYRAAKPAVDESDFLNHGACLGTTFSSDGAKPGSGALEFGPNAVVRVPWSPSWDSLRGLVVDVLARFDGDLSDRRNLVEGDGCFAFYVAPDGDLRFDFFGLMAGGAAPGWHGVSSVSHATGPEARLVAGRWVRLRASFDGLTTARLWIDGRQVAQRSGFRSSIGSPGGAGVSIGNWTLGEQYPLLGALDWVAVWKLDEDAVNKEFVERLDPTAKAGWSGMMGCLARTIDEKHLDALRDAHEELLLAVNECVAEADPDAREAFHRMLDRYNDLWTKDRIDRPEFHDVVVEIHRLLTSICPGSIADRFLRFSRLFGEIAGGARLDCFERAALAEADPRFRAAFSSFGEQDFS